MIFFHYCKVTTLIAIATFFGLCAPIVTSASATISWSPGGLITKTPVTVSVVTTGDFQDAVDGIGCDNPSFTNWALHFLVRDLFGNSSEIFGAVMGSSDKTTSEIFDLLLGFYDVNIVCSDAPVQDQNNGESNNSSLIGTFEVHPWAYLRSPSGFYPGSAISIAVGFNQFVDTGCDAGATSWRLALYDTNGEVLFASTNWIPAATLSGTFPLSLPVGEYGTVEIECLWNDVNFSASVFLENAVGETIFSVPVAAHRDEEIIPAPVGDFHPLPTITMLSPFENLRAGLLLPVVYDANFDRVDTSGRYDLRGLAVSSVALYYTTAKEISASSTLVINNLPAKGEYSWDVSKMPEGDDYQIVAKATDNINRVVTLASDNFSIDHTPPAFRITADPPVSHGEEVIVSVDSEEDLDATNTPRIRVEQQFAGPITLETKGSGKHFETIYYPVRGHDGEVKVTAYGFDRAGNKGDKVISGGFFYLGIEPPEKPIVSYPLPNDTFSSATTSVVGTSRRDTEVVLTVNGSLVLKKKTDTEGNFRFDNVAISKEFQRGVNMFSLVAFDQTGHQSVPAEVRVKYNIPPKLSITSPKDGDILSRAVIIRANVKDDNNDAILFSYELSHDKGVTWDMLAKNSKIAEYKWRTMDSADGEYMVRVTASDGYEKAVVTTGVLVVRNYLPHVFFDGKAKEVTNKLAATISGVVHAEKSPGVQRSPISEVEYRIGDEINWHKAVVKKDPDDEFNLLFSFEMSGLSEGAYPVLVRAKDERNFYGNEQKTLIVDFGPPRNPTILSPKSESVLSITEDEDTERAGVQFTLRGTSEAGALIEVAVGALSVVTGETSKDGTFAIAGITVRDHGKNNISVTATDAAGNKSGVSHLTVVRNDPPTIRFRTPRNGRGLGHDTLLRWEISDPEGDPTTAWTLSYRKGASGAFTLLKKSREGNTYSFDVSKMKEGADYQIKLETTDGISSAVGVVTTTIDNTLPTIEPIPMKETAFRQSFTLRFEIEARDTLSGVEYVEYAINKEESWLSERARAEKSKEEIWYKALVGRGYLTAKAVASIKHPLVLSDGIYVVSVRSVDASGNVSVPATKKIIVDTTPPHIGSYTFSHKALLFYPRGGSLRESDGDKFYVAEGETIALSLSLQEDTKTALLFVSGVSSTTSNTLSSSSRDVILPLVKEKRNGLWESVIPFPHTGTTTLSVVATDNVGNTSQKTALGMVVVLPKGRITDTLGIPLPDARVSVQILSGDSGMFEDWNGDQFGLESSLKTDEQGNYALLLPQGTYRLSIQKNGYGKVRSKEFEVLNAEYVTAIFQLEKRKGIRGVIENAIDRMGIFSN